MKKRPVVVIRLPTDDNPTFDYLGCSTIPPDEVEAPWCVKLNSAGPPNGDRYTKLKEPTWLRAHWSGEMYPDEIENPDRDISGKLHEEQLVEVLTLVAAVRAASIDGASG